MKGGRKPELTECSLNISSGTSHLFDQHNYSNNVKAIFQSIRSGFYNSALKLSQLANITDLTNINLFLVAKEVEEALAVKDTSKCLAWCHDNKSKMRKMKSNLEFNVRLQEFIELVKQGRKMDAVKHARWDLECALMPRS